MNIKMFGVNTEIVTYEKEVLNMDAQRAQEVADSTTMANVLYNGSKIYIEHVDQQNGMATIHSLDNPNSKQSVSVSSLIEQ
jgi:small acid-soluble spore protein H (minor)